jgi:hypothetical protein
MMLTTRERTMQWTIKSMSARGAVNEMANRIARVIGKDISSRRRLRERDARNVESAPPSCKDCRRPVMC